MWGENMRGECPNVYSPRSNLSDVRVRGRYLAVLSRSRQAAATASALIP